MGSFLLKFPEQRKDQLKDEKEISSAAFQNPMSVSEKDIDLALAAEHGHKSRLKWEKLERKEAKKSQKAAAQLVRKLSQVDWNSVVIIIQNSIL